MERQERSSGNRYGERWVTSMMKSFVMESREAVVCYMHEFLKK